MVSGHKPTNQPSLASRDFTSNPEGSRVTQDVQSLAAGILEALLPTLMIDLIILLVKQGEMYFGISKDYLTEIIILAVSEKV